jgi:hypothetical protein
MLGLHIFVISYEHFTVNDHMLGSFFLALAARKKVKAHFWSQQHQW